MTDKKTVADGLLDVIGYLKIKMFSDGLAAEMLETVKQAKKLLEDDCEDDYVVPVRDNRWRCLEVWVCPECGSLITTKKELNPKHCQECGRKVKWDG